MTRREVLYLPLVPLVAGIAAACQPTTPSPTGPTLAYTVEPQTQPLLSLLQTKYGSDKVSYVKNVDGGTEVVINGSRSWHVKIGDNLIGADPSRSATAADSRPNALDVANYPVPNGTTWSVLQA